MTELVHSGIFTAFVIATSISLLYFFAFLVYKKFVHVDYLKNHHDLAGFILTAIAALYSIFLGFTAVNAQETHTKTIAKANKEAYLSATLYRTTHNFPESVSLKMQNGILEYLKSVKENEWPLMGSKLESPATLAKLENMWAPFYQYDPSNVRQQIWMEKAVGLLDQLNNARLERIYSSWETLSPISWWTLIIGAFFLSIFLFLFGTQNTGIHILINSILISYMSIVIFGIYVLSRPFGFFDPVSASAYEVVYNYYSENNGKSPELQIFK